MQSSYRIEKILGNRFTPCGLADKLQAPVILESSSFKKGRERFSILMVDEAFRISQSYEGELSLINGQKSKVIRSKARDILDISRYFADQFGKAPEELPFPSGGIGYLSYEFAARCDSVSFKAKNDALDLPEALLLFGSRFVIFDHFTDEIYLLALSYKEAPQDNEEAIEGLKSRINDLDFNYLVEDNRSYPAEPLQRKDDQQRFTEGVEAIQDHIIRGNLLQAVLSREIAAKTELPALEAYKRLRSANPSPYLFYLDFGFFQLFGASPEVQVKTEGQRAEIRPIAGTRRRGTGAEEDKALEKELLSDPKERAEHLMLVDLARNDIGRVCRPGSVSVDEYMEIEYYSHVMHIVSKVTGTLNEDADGMDLLRATFPAGTVSGAPKISAMTILDGLEDERRGFYAGVVGYFGPGNALDTCITIRSAVKKDGIIYLRAGAGIVLDSTPEREYEETQEKLMALASSIGLEV